jgi:hypothetical protein
VPIRIARGQRKSILAEYFQGDETSPPIDLSNALFSVDDANFPVPMNSVLFQTVNLALGKINIVVTDECSTAMRSGATNWFTVKVVIGDWEDVSDPIEFEVTAA